MTVVADADTVQLATYAVSDPNNFLPAPPKGLW
jgi:hypothetical protein